IPLLMVLLDNPVAKATVFIPSFPKDTASTPDHNRLSFSSMYGVKASNLVLISSIIDIFPRNNHFDSIVSFLDPYQKLISAQLLSNAIASLVNRSGALPTLHQLHQL
ncbi:MAG: hypothetical protein F6K37_36560, partial [Moorea sp. SIO4E2]|uniref:hypothetical protein n=1 Tax=Moorena sp. SIO4E2 TaxID=2607826 RepID=UPI0013BB6C6D